MRNEPKPCVPLGVRLHMSGWPVRGGCGKVSERVGRPYLILLSMAGLSDLPSLPVLPHHAPRRSRRSPRSRSRRRSCNCIHGDGDGDDIHAGGLHAPHACVDGQDDPLDDRGAACTPRRPGLAQGEHGPS